MGLMPSMATFVKVVEFGSFSSAAEQLGLTASALSRQISSLEKALSVKLLERTTRQLRLTEAGAEAYVRSCAMVETARSVMEVADRFNSTPQGLVRLSAPKAFGRKLVGPLVPGFLSLYPEVDVQLILTDRPMDLIGDDVDLIIRITDDPPLGLAARPLLRVHHVLCATQKYLSKNGTPHHPHDLARHSCLYLGEISGDNRWQFRHSESSELVSVSVRGRYVVNHSEARLDGVLEHLGIGCLPFFTADKVLRERSVVQVLPGWQYVTSYYGKAWILYHPNRYLPPKCRALIDYLAEKLSAL